MVEAMAELLPRVVIDRVLAIAGAGPGDRERVSSKFEALATEAKSRVADRPDAEKARALVEFLKQAGFRPDSGQPGVDLARFLELFRGNCVEHSILLVVLGRELGISMRAVRVPGHMFVRARGGGVSTNVEAMDLGAFPTLDEYAMGFRVTERQQGLGLYLGDLSDSVLLAEVAHKVLYPALSAGERLSLGRRYVLREALKAHPQGTDLMNSLGLSCLRRGRFSWGERWFRKALGLDPDCTPALNNLVQALVSQARYRDAIEVAERSTVPNALSENPLLLRNLGRAYLRVGQYDRASRVYEDLKRIFEATRWPVENQLIHPYLSCLSYCLGDYQASASSALVWAATSPSNQIGVVWAASAYRRDDAEEEARRLLDATSFADPFVADLAAMMCGVLDGRDLTDRFPERRAEIESYLGEYWAPVDLDRALDHWRNCLDSGDRQTFAFLRAERNLIDQGARVAPTSQSVR